MKEYQRAGTRSDASGGNGGGGGCSISTQGVSIDPVLPQLMISSLFYLMRRRCRV